MHFWIEHPLCSYLSQIQGQIWSWKWKKDRYVRSTNNAVKCVMCEGVPWCKTPHCRHRFQTEKGGEHGCEQVPRVWVNVLPLPGRPKHGCDGTMPWMGRWALVGNKLSREQPYAQTATRASSTQGSVNRAQFREQEEGLPLSSQRVSDLTWVLCPLWALHTAKTLTNWRVFTGDHRDSGGWKWVSPVSR